MDAAAVFVAVCFSGAFLLAAGRMARDVVISSRRGDYEWAVTTGVFLLALLGLGVFLAMFFASMIQHDMLPW